MYFTYVWWGSPLSQHCRLVPLFIGSNGDAFVVWAVWLELFSFFLGAPFETSLGMVFPLGTSGGVPLGMSQL